MAQARTLAPTAYALGSVVLPALLRQGFIASPNGIRFKGKPRGDKEQCPLRNTHVHKTRFYTSINPCENCHWHRSNQGCSLFMKRNS